MDISVEPNKSAWQSALKTAVNAAGRGWLNDWQLGFVKDMKEMDDLNGDLFEPSVKQYNALIQIAVEYR